MARKHGLGQVAEEREIGWPGHWRLPAVGESVDAGPGWGGSVQWVTWDLARGIIVIALR